MGVRTNIDLSLQVGQDNALTDLAFGRDLQSVFDTLDHENTAVFTLAASEANVVVPFGDVQQARVVYIEADAEFDMTIGGGLATAGTQTGVAGAYPTGFIGGETFSYVIDGLTVAGTFEAADQSLQQVVNRINSYAALVAAGTIASVSGSNVKLTSLTLGASSTVEVEAGTSNTALGLTVSTDTGDASTPGTSPIQVRRPGSISGAGLGAGLPAVFFGTIQASSIMLANPSASLEVSVRICIVGDLSAYPC